MSKNTYYSKVNLHIVDELQWNFIERNLVFRDFLRHNQEYRLEYQNLKYSLLQHPESYNQQVGPLTGYNLGKHDFITSVLAKTNFNGTVLQFCCFNSEWQEYHRIKRQQIFTPLNIDYEPDHPSMSDKNHLHFILYKGTKIVSIAHIEFIQGNEVALRALATDTAYKNQGFGSYVMRLLEKWLKRAESKQIKLHSNTAAESFYRKLGYKEVRFEDVSISPNTIDLGKEL